MPRITNSRCVLAVRDLAVSTRFYMDVLGFGRDFGDGTDGHRIAFGEPVSISS